MKDYPNIVILTGAGVSAESGIQTFRATDGLWHNHRIEDVASPEGFARNPTLVHQFYNARRRQLHDPSYNPTRPTAPWQNWNANTPANSCWLHKMLMICTNALVTRTSSTCTANYTKSVVSVADRFFTGRMTSVPAVCVNVATKQANCVHISSGSGNCRC